MTKMGCLKNMSRNPILFDCSKKIVLVILKVWECFSFYDG